MRIDTDIELDFGDLGYQPCHLKGEVWNGRVHGFQIIWNGRDITHEINKHGISFIHDYMAELERNEPDAMALAHAQKELDMEREEGA